MRRYLKFHRLLVVAVLIVLLSASLLQAKTVKPGQAIVKVRGNNDINVLAAQYNLGVADSISAQKSYLLTFTDDRTVEDVLIELSADNSIELATENTVIDLPEINQISQGFPDENRPIFNQGTEPRNFYGQSGSYELGIDSAHVISTGRDVIVAVIDNGLDLEHPLMISSNILTGHDFVDGGSDPSEQDGTIQGHGTFVAGLILLTSPECKIMPLRTFDGNGNSDQFTVAKAIDWAVRHNADIINMSFSSDEMTETLYEAIEDAYNAGVIMVAASGNDGLEQNNYPAAHQKVIGVAAIDTSELLAPFSNYGEYVDVVAPGVNLYSSLAGEFEWGTWSGTSFAVPFVTGTAALVKQIESEYSPDQMSDHLRYTARTELLWGDVIPPDLQYGFGMINSYNAVIQLSLGDLDGSGTRDMADLTLMVDYLNSQYNGNGNSNSESGFAPQRDMIDVNCDGNANMSDVAVMVHHIFVNWRVFAPCYSRNSSETQ